MNNLETESHIGAGITIRYRKNIDPVDVLPALEKALYTGGQTPHQAGRINVRNALGQCFKPGENELNKSLA